MPDFQKRAIKITFVTFLIYLFLVATHEGEFWPFSIYPMFSQAGNPWTRARVQDVTDVPDSLRWTVTDISSLPGTPVSVRANGVDQIDFSNFVSKTTDWTDTRKNALITMFGADQIGGREWMVVKVNGHLVGDDSVQVTGTPFLMLTEDSVFTNPVLPPEAYHRE